MASIQHHGALLSILATISSWSAGRTAGGDTGARARALLPLSLRDYSAGGGGYGRRLRITLKRIEGVGRLAVRSRGHQAEHVVSEVRDEAIRFDFL
jgi:hypothetical protein